MSKLFRTLNPEVKIIDAKRGLVDYVASDQTIDAYREVILAKGWRFDMFRRNAPLVDSHDYGTIAKLVGKVTDFRVEGDKLIERAQWAVDVEGNELAQIGFKMTEAGYLKAVSVGFWPVRAVSRYNEDKSKFYEVAKELGLDAELADKVQRIFLEQQQVELSVCIIGANPNALAKAYKADAISEAELMTIGRLAEEDITRLRNFPNLSTASQPEDDTPNSTHRQPSPAAVEQANQQRARADWLREFKQLTNQD